LDVLGVKDCVGQTYAQATYVAPGAKKAVALSTLNIMVRKPLVLRVAVYFLIDEDNGIAPSGINPPNQHVKEVRIADELCSQISAVWTRQAGIVVRRSTIHDGVAALGVRGGLIGDHGKGNIDVRHAEELILSHFEGTPSLNAPVYLFVAPALAPGKTLGDGNLSGAEGVTMVNGGRVGILICDPHSVPPEWNPQIAIAHEMGHAMGLSGDYNPDPNAPRVPPWAPETAEDSAAWPELLMYFQATGDRVLVSEGNIARRGTSALVKSR
jgi:hypothetical protein